MPLHPTILLSEDSPGMHGGKQRPFRAFARPARVRGEAAQFSASPWALRATQKRPCLPGSTPGTVPGARRQRHCARGAAAGGMLHTCPLIRGRAPPTLAEGQPEAARGSRGRSPSCPSLVPFLGKQERNSLSVDYRQALRPPGGISKTTPGRDPANYTAH
ncbi:hypothetical protein CE91St45_07630 [Oscillospiraceae bacterium]|nr:hypothetical protein CE91St45_07630 [Oscillospiraceae bacterium]